MKNNLLGKWYKQKDHGEDYIEIEIVDVKGEVCFLSGMGGKTIDVNTLTTQYVRSSEISADPYANPELQNMKSFDSTMQVNEELIQKSNQEDASTIFNDEVVNDRPSEILAKIENSRRTLTASEQVIQSSIDASQKTAKFKVELEIELPIEIETLLAVSNALSIPNKEVADVLAENIKIDESVVMDMLKEYLVKAIDSTDE